MMKYRVRRAFKYKLTRIRYLPGETFETNDPEVAKRLKSRSLIESRAIGGNFSAPVTRLPNVPDLGKEIKSVGGGWWELPDGSRIQGKAAALKAIEEDDGDEDAAREP